MIGLSRPSNLAAPDLARVYTRVRSSNDHRNHEAETVAKKPTKHGQPWTKRDTAQIGILARKGVDTDDIAKRLGRTKDAIYSKASEEGVSLRPKDKPNK